MSGICKGCGGPIRSDNKYGFCVRNPSCHNENQRRHAIKSRENRLAYNRVHAAKRKEYITQWRAGQKHEDLTYLRYSPGLNIHKIGHTTNLTANHEAIRRGCPDIVLIATFPYGLKLERFLHDRFFRERIKGTEWFRDINEVMVRAAVKEYESQLSIAA